MSASQSRFGASELNSRRTRSSCDGVPGLERFRVFFLPNTDHQPFSEQRRHTVRSPTLKPAAWTSSARNRYPNSGSSQCARPSAWTISERGQITRDNEAQNGDHALARVVWGGVDSAGRLGVGSRGRALELVSDERLITRDPRIVSRFDRIRVALGEVLFGPIVVDDMHTPGDDGPHVSGLTAFRADDLLDALRPTPARLQCFFSCSASTEIYNLDT